MERSNRTACPSKSINFPFITDVTSYTPSAIKKPRSNIETFASFSFKNSPFKYTILDITIPIILAAQDVLRQHHKIICGYDLHLAKVAHQDQQPKLLAQLILRVP